MILTVAVDFGFGIWLKRLIERGRKGSARCVLILSVVYNIGQLILFKYFDFFGSGLPIGISFYTFQALSYVIDVYRTEVSATKSLVDFGAYVSLFPQLIAGPIVKYSEIERELCAREYRLCDIADGARRFCAGLSKKVILANPSGEMWESLRADGSFVGTQLALIFFALQIYFDFSGYSDMAIGLGKILGFRFPENFNYPYISKSVSEFWRRWHMTLSSFFREYVYIPLGGNRCGIWKNYRNLFITWGLTGLWHGASVNFLLWGLYFALILIIEKTFLKRVLSVMPSAISHLYALLLIGFGWVIFVADGSFDGIGFALRFFGVGCESFCSGTATYDLLRNLLFLAVAVIGCTPMPRRLYLKIKERFALADIALPLMAFLLSLAYIVSSGYDPFLYFRF